MISPSMSDIKITHDQFIGVYENVLSREDCKSIIDFFENDFKNNFDGNKYIHGVEPILKGERYTLPIWYKIL